MVLGLVMGFLSGLVVGWIQGSEPLKAKVKVLEIQLRNQKGSVQEWPRANSYWNFEGPKLKQRVMDLEMELEYLRNQTLWKKD